MRTIRTKVYQFSELSAKAKKAVVENYRGINVIHDWWECTYEDAEQAGINILGFDLDSASFVSNVTGEFLLAANEVAQNILNNHGEHCETYKTTAKFMEQWQPVFNKYMQTEQGEDKLMKIEDAYLNAILKDYEVMLQEQLDYEYSDKAVIETIEGNDYEFTSEGKRYNQ